MYRLSYMDYALSVILGLVLCFIPLFNLVGYESAAVTGLVVALLSVWALRRRVRQRYLDYTVASFLCFFASSLRLLIPPLFLLSLNALRVENCSWQDGLLFWLLIPPVSMLFVQSAYWIGEALFPKRGGWFAALVSAVEIVSFLLQLANQPPIAGHEVFIGWFAGSIYDEALVVPPSLWWFRLYVILWSALFLCLAQWYREPKSRPLGLWCVGLLFGLLAIRLQAPSLMSQHNHVSVRAALGAQAESEHFLFYYDREQIDADLLPFLLEDAEFRYWELQRYLQEDPVAWKGRKIEIYIYPSAEVQFRLMGSRNTFVARPWTHQVHLRWDGYTDSVLAHEIAHIFTAPFGRGPLKMAGKGAFLIDTGMVEGIAVAADWRPEDLNPHLASAALRKMNKAPDLRSLFSAGGFWSQPSGKAYTMTGSFVRWLVEVKGIDPYKTLYRSGDFQKAYERDAASLIVEWERFLDQIPLTERTLSMAQYRYDRRSIFQKSCARSMAEKRRQARVAVRSDDFERALLLYRELEQREAGNFRLQLQIIRVLMMLERWEEANLVIEDSLSQEPSSAYVARLNEYKGDIEWRRGNTNDAIDSYRGCQEMGLVDSRMRTLEAKIVGIESASVQRYLLDRNTRSKMLYLAMDWQSRSDNPLADYLVGVQLHGLLEFPAVIQALEPIVLSSAILEEQRMFLLAQAYFHTGRFPESKALWTRLADGTNTRLQMESEEWLRRILWKEEVSKK